MWKINKLEEWIIYNRLKSTWISFKIWKEYKQEFICECWIKKFYYLYHLTSWFTKSCWCLNKELLKQRRKTHWMSKSRLYNTYMNIKKRCCNLDNKDYMNYWWRWIQIKWNSFEEFKKDMYDNYLLHVEEFWENNTSIDRIDNNWNYEPNNCKWSTYIEQNNNKRNNNK